MQREPELDWLRGLMLVLMTVTHLPTWFSAQLGQPFGFVSAAEGFVFVSAFLVGRVYTRIGREQGHAAMRRRLWQRAGRIYAVHVALLLYLFWMLVPAAETLGATAITDLASYYRAEPRAALVGGLLLVYQPPLLDILPMYVLFMALSPFALHIGARHGWGRIFLASGALWVAAQLDLGRVVHHVLDVPVPYRQTGAFALLAWQLMWVAGLAAGACSARGAPRRAPVPRNAWRVAVVVAVAFFAWRHAAGQVPSGAAWLVGAVDKWHLGALRLVDFAALAAIVVAARGLIAERARTSPLAMLGRSSLAVFCAHLVLCLGALALVAEPWPATLHWQDSALLMAALAALYAVAWVVTGRRPARVPLPASSPAARTAR